ncbi:MAG TPA: methyltransferase domain-containing protein [Gaiellaceae bacterium]|jgi:SAM-dependent methyltransferase|nr:methyltransferase domain-containing protein [Gaiellaceae bacterium]
MPWYHAVAERDHELLNPTNPAKIRLLGERLRLGPDSRVVDLACGKAGPALILAESFGCRVLGVERAPEFVADARVRVETAGLTDRIEIVEGDAAAFPLEPGTWDAVLCLGASFVWHGLDGTLEALAPAVRPGGNVVVGEPFWRSWPLPAGIDDDGYLPLRETVARFETAGLALVSLIASSEDDWDTYESLRWRAVEEWLAQHPDDPDAREIRLRHEASRDAYLRYERALFGWAIFVGRVP